jgi:RimJ/RimL family protein N-acetyltransferase
VSLLFLFHFFFFVEKKEGYGRGFKEGANEEETGMVGTNRWCKQGMEVGYCMNVRYWGKGYATEGFRAFLELFWGLPGEFSPFSVLQIVHLG